MKKGFLKKAFHFNAILWLSDPHHNKKPKLRITRDKNRGKGVERAPWFIVFEGDRISYHHLKVAEKQKA